MVNLYKEESYISYDEYVDRFKHILISLGCENVHDGEVDPEPNLEEFLQRIQVVEPASNEPIGNKYEEWWIFLYGLMFRDKGGITSATADERIQKVKIIGWFSNDHFQESVNYARQKTEAILINLRYSIGLLKQTGNIQLEDIKGQWQRIRPKGLGRNNNLFFTQSMIEFSIRDIVRYKYPKNLTRDYIKEHFSEGD